jgi:hypothetical protein
LLSQETIEDEDDENADNGLSEAVQEAFEDVVDNASLFSPSEERDDEYFQDESDEMTLLDSNGNANGHANGLEKAVSEKRDEYRLALTDEQLSMMNGLRSLSWKTFGVHIHQTSHSHAAIIKRTRWRNDLSEGQVVIQHWLQDQFEV